MNTVALSGNLTRDPEMRATNSGMTVLSFSIAVNERKKQGEQWVDVPNYFDISMFGRQAEYVGGRIHKGSKVAISGRLHWAQWESNGNKRSKVEVIANEVVLMSGANGTSQATTEPQTPVYDSDIPF